jgi:hypothetical protein
VFLIQFDRREGRLLEVLGFDDGCRAEAEGARFRAERAALEADADMEIVTLEADSLEELEQTHGSYFVQKSLPLPV